MKDTTKLERLKALMNSTDPPMKKKDACVLLGLDINDPDLIEDIPDFLKDLLAGNK